MMHTLYGQERSVEPQSESQKPPPGKVESISTKSESSSAYKSKSVSWEEQVNLNLQNADAWKNYYLAVRYQDYSKNNKTPKTATQVKLDSILTEMKGQVPNSYEYNYLYYINSNYDVNAFSYLEKAYQMNPNNNEIYDEMVAHYEITSNQVQKKAFCQKINASGKYSANTMEYAYNTLQSVGQNGVIFTNGEIDTYPLMVQQEVFGVRKDVVIINLDLIKTLTYRNTLKSKNINTTYSGSDTKLIEDFLNNNKSKEVYLSLTVKPFVISALSGRLYLTGLAFRVSNSTVENSSVMYNNWLNFKKSSLKLNNLKTNDKLLNNNYILMLSELFSLYKDVSERIADEYKEAAKTIAISSGIWNRVETKFL